MTVEEMMPTPKPAMRRPTTRRGIVVDTIWRMTPTLKIKQAPMMDGRRPIMSASEPAKRAPKKVPAERMDVTRDFCDVEMLKPEGSTLVGTA
jgi:hypothetical protein